jgi:hypothetical protein
MNNSNQFFLFRIIFLPLLTGFLTYLCLENSFTKTLEGVDLIFFGGLFFVFAITVNTANFRRFQAIEELAVLWSLAMSYWNTGKRHLTKEELDNLQHELRDFFEKLRFLMHEDVVGEEAKRKLLDIDSFFNALSLSIEDFRKTKTIGEPELACLLGWLENMYSSFEKLLAIKEHRTPRSLRLFIDWALVIGVLLLTPQFALFGIYGVLSSTVIMCFLITLIKIQKNLEYPFGKYIDHIDLRLKEKAYRRIA